MNERSSHHPHGGPPDGWDPEASELADPPRIVVAGDGVECEASSVHFSNPADRAATAFRETLVTMTGPPLPFTTWMNTLPSLRARSRT